MTWNIDVRSLWEPKLTIVSFVRLAEVVIKFGQEVAALTQSTSLLLFNNFVQPQHTFGSFWKWCKASNSAIFKVPYLLASAWFAKCCSMTRLTILWLANQQATIMALLFHLPGGLTSGAMWQPKWYQHWPTSEALCRLHLHAANTWYLVMWFCWCLLYTYSCASFTALFLFPLFVDVSSVCCPYFSYGPYCSPCVRSCDPSFSSSYVCLFFFSIYIWLTQSSLDLIATRNEKRAHVLQHLLCLPGTYSQLPKPSRALDQLIASKRSYVGVQRWTAVKQSTNRANKWCAQHIIYKQSFLIMNM